MAASSAYKDGENVDKKLIFSYFLAWNMLSHVVWCKVRYVSYVSGDFAQSHWSTTKLEQVKTGSCIPPISTTAYSNQLNLHT